MKQTAVEWLVEQYIEKLTITPVMVEQAKEMEKKNKLTHQLFVGKVTDVIGFDKTLDLLRECYNELS